MGTAFNRMMAMALKEAQGKFPTNEKGMPEPTNFPELLSSYKSFIKQHEKLYDITNQLAGLLPPEKIYLALDEFRSLFLADDQYSEAFDQVIQLHPSGIALIVLNDFFKNTDRFEIVQPENLPRYSELRLPIEPVKLTHTTIEIGNDKATVPLSNSLWVKDKEKGFNFILNYAPNQSGSVTVELSGDDAKSDQVIDFAQELKFALLKSSFIRGKIIEITSGSDFRVVDIGEQPYPIIEDSLRAELEKNIINLFDKQAKFKEYGIPLRRSVILSGPPGCGKTMIEKWLASKVKGKVTTLWITAKSIQSTSNVSSIFEIARKLSPTLIVMEDLDLISGTRALRGMDNPLGEMLNQMDGLTSDDSIVIVGSTNSVHSLDEALKERPNRFDRIYEVGKPNRELSAEIARNYLRGRNVPETVIQDLSLDSLSTGDFTGAQIVEIAKGGIFEAIHRNCEINDLCIRASKDGLVNQKKLTHKN